MLIPRPWFTGDEVPLKKKHSEDAEHPGIIPPRGAALLRVCAGLPVIIHGEFDPGSGRTLAACLTHASRTVKPFGVDQWRTGE